MKVLPYGFQLSMVQRRTVEHDPSSGCRGHCTIHHVDEWTHLKAFLGCAECGHLYRRPRDLRKASRRACWRALRYMLGKKTPGLTFPLRYQLQSLVLGTFPRAKRIYSCPHCAADF